MSGHSKWSKIKRQKGAADARRGNLFTKLGRAITLAARQGGGDTEMNFALRLAIDKARTGNMPKDNIDRAVKRGTGEDKSGTIIEEVLYEGFGSGGVGVLVDVVTDNKNRSAADIKHLLSKHGGSMGGPGSVKWQFEQRGVVYLKDEPSDDLQLELMDAGAQDIKQEEDETVIYTVVPDLKKVIDTLKKLNIEPKDSGLEWIPKETVMVDESTGAKLQRLFEVLDEHDDVQNVYSNEA